MTNSVRFAIRIVVCVLLCQFQQAWSQQAPVAPQQPPIEFKVPVGEGRLGGRGGRLMQRFGGRGGRLQERLRGVMGEDGVDLSRPRAQLLIQGVDMLLGPDVNIGADASGVNVRIHPDAITNAIDGVRGQIAPAVGFAGDAEYGLTIYPEPDADCERLVVVVHGFNSTPNGFHHVVSALRAEGKRIATFYYDSTQGVEAAAKTLSTHLNGWVENNPDYKITLLTHSMGGICSRCMVEDPELDIEAVDQLIMIAPPNHGSEWARVGMIDEPLRGGAVSVDRPQVARVINLIAGQVNSAIGDMRPDSKLLQNLNDKSRNERVEYSILLGNKAPLTEKQAVILAEVVSSLGDESAVAELVGQQAADTLEQVSSEAVGRRGDGVVSVDSGRLAGVDDVEVLHFSHNDLMNANSDGWEKLKPEILERVK